MEKLELDKKTLAYGPVTKYFSDELLEKDISWYESSGYRIYSLDASKWYTIEDFHSDCHEVFMFPAYYGRNWGAFDDVISEIHSGEKGNVLVCIRDFDSWYKREAGSAQTFLDIMSDQTYSYLVAGNRFITLIKVSNPHFNARNVGAKSVHWNWAEWDNKNRGV